MQCLWSFAGERQEGKELLEGSRSQEMGYNPWLILGTHSPLGGQGHRVLERPPKFFCSFWESTPGFLGYEHSRKICCQRQLWLYRHVACYSEAKPAPQVAFSSGSLKWRRPRGCLQSLWYKQVHKFYPEILGMGRRPAHRLAQWNHQILHYGVGEATYPPAYACIDWLSETSKVGVIQKLE